jgi:two-component system KDP operon response regulator KdpE
VQSRGQIVRLSVKKYEVLRALAENVDRPVTKAHLLRVVWGERGLDRLAYLRVAIRDLRRQIEDDPSHPRYIVTEPGIGYRLAVNLS